MDDRWQQRTEQELRIVLLRVDKRDGLRGECSRGGRCGGGAAGGGGDGRRGGKRVAQARGRNAGRCQELLVIEPDDLRPPLGLQVALEIRRDMDCRNRLSGPYVLYGRGQRARAVDDFQARRRRDIFHQRARCVRFVLVDDRHAQPPYHRTAEDGCEDYEREERHAEDQKQRHAIAKQPAALAPSDQQKSGL